MPVRHLFKLQSRLYNDYVYIKFAFTDTENNYIVSLEAATASVYLLFVPYLIPGIRDLLSRKNKKQADQDVLIGNGGRDGQGESDRKVAHGSADLPYSLLSMSTQLIGMPCFVVAGSAPTLYALVVVVDLGIGASSFIKSYAMQVGNEKESVLASMATMESIGGLLSPIVLGLAQNLAAEGGVFIVGAASVAVAMLSLLGTIAMRRRPLDQ